MLRILLYICAGLFPCLGLAQNSEGILTGPSETVIEDPGQTVNNLACGQVGNSVLVSWQVGTPTPDFLTIERSENGKPFEVVTILNNVGEKPQYQWTDEAPHAGRNFYRIRYSFREGQPLYSRSVSYFIAGNTSLKFYPNPVDHILIVRSESPIDVLITDANGRPRLTESRVQGLRTINVSSLEKGIYLIRFSNKLTNIISQEKLVKN